MDRLKRTGLGADLDRTLAVIHLNRDRVYRIGRNADQEIRIVDDMISREHSKLTFDQQAWYVEDRRSLNKTHINGSELVPFQVGFWGWGLG